MTAHRAACLGVVAWCLAYLATAMFPIPLPCYHPITGHWRWAARVGPAEMRYYGQVAFATLAGLAVAAPLLLARRGPEAPPPSSDVLAPLWALTSLLGCAAYHVWHNWP